MQIFPEFLRPAARPGDARRLARVEMARGVRSRTADGGALSTNKYLFGLKHAYPPVKFEAATCFGAPIRRRK